MCRVTGTAEGGDGVDEEGANTPAVATLCQALETETMGTACILVLTRSIGRVQILEETQARVRVEWLPDEELQFLPGPDCTGLWKTGHVLTSQEAVTLVITWVWNTTKWKRCRELRGKLRHSGLPEVSPEHLEKLRPSVSETGQAAGEQMTEGILRDALLRAQLLSFGILTEIL
eukprot:gene18283-21797_t